MKITRQQVERLLFISMVLSTASLMGVYLIPLGAEESFKYSGNVENLKTALMIATWLWYIAIGSGLIIIVSAGALASGLLKNKEEKVEQCE